MKNPRIKEMAGKTFGSWLVLRQDGNTKGGGALWLCRCKCGEEKTVLGSDLRKGRTKSCGCASRMLGGDRNRTHGLTGTRIYRIWGNMRARCYRPSCPSYKDYGARGISICAEWDDFESFHEWAISNGYAEGLSIERIDVNGNYCPENCTWADAKTQSRNRRFCHTRKDGKTWAEVAEEHGIPTTLMHGRLHDGWPIEQAATHPRYKRRKLL